MTTRVPHGESDRFLLGLLSLIDAMLDMPMETVLDKLPLDRESKAVLLGQPGILQPVFQLMLAHESGEWESARDLSQIVHRFRAGRQHHWQAQHWARQVSIGE